MHIIYCLINESFKENILSVGITPSSASLYELVEAPFLPTPYTILFAKYIYNPHCIDLVCALLGKFGKHLKGPFFEISPDIVKPLFELIHDRYIIIQDDIEYSVPHDNADANGIYDRLFAYNYSDLDL
jgi:hypothetical protein